MICHQVNKKTMSLGRYFHWNGGGREGWGLGLGVMVRMKGVFTMRNPFFSILILWLGVATKLTILSCVFLFTGCRVSGAGVFFSSFLTNTNCSHDLFFFNIVTNSHERIVILTFSLWAKIGHNIILIYKFFVILGNFPQNQNFGEMCVGLGLGSKWRVFYNEKSAFSVSDYLVSGCHQIYIALVRFWGGSAACRQPETKKSPKRRIYLVERT